MAIKVIIFDFGGVIINLDREACVNRYKELGISNADQLLDNYMQSGVFLDLEKGNISIDDFHEQIRLLSNNNLSDKDIDDAFHRFLLDIPLRRMNKILELRKRFRTVILSNTNQLHFPIESGKLVNSDFLIKDYFDSCYLSFRMHMSKPDEEIYNALLENEGVKAEECLYLDDGEKNISTAHRLGFNCYLVKNDNWIDEIDGIINSI